jgi:hypothetical protein
MYRVPFTFTMTNANGDVDLVSLVPADDKPIRLTGWLLGQTSEVGDIQEEDLQITVRHMTATVSAGSGGAAVTPVPNRPGTDAAAGFTARAGDTTVSTTSGTDTVMERLGWNERNTPWERWIPEELRPRAAQGESLVLRNETTVADDVVIAGTLFVEEEG